MKIRNAVTLKGGILIAAILFCNAATFAYPPQTISGQVRIPCTSPLIIPIAQAPITDILLNLNCNVSSSIISPSNPTAGTEISFKILNAGGFTITLPSVFQPSSSLPTISTGAGTETNFTYQYCGIPGFSPECPSGTWFNTDVGPAGASNLCGNSSACIDVTQFGAKFKLKRTVDATWVSGSNPTTVTSASANFVTSDFPASFKGVFSGTSLCSNLGSATFISATQISVTCAGNGVGNPVGGGLIAWGPNDISAGKSIDAQAITAATTAAAALCATFHSVLLKMPVGQAFIDQGQLGTIPTGCIQGLGEFFGANTGFNVMGGSPGCRTCTVLVPVPGFNFSTGGGAGCFWNGAGGNNSAGSYQEGYTVDGAGDSLSGTNTAPCNTMFSAAIAGGNKHIGLINWGNASSPKFRAYHAGNQAGPNIDIQVDTFGDSIATCDNTAEIHASFFGGGMAGGQCLDYGGWYGGDNPANTVVMSFSVPNIVYHGMGTVIQGIGSNTAGILVGGAGEQLYFNDIQMPSSVPTNSPMFDFTANGNLYLKNSQMLGGTTSGLCAGSVGAFFNLGGNVYQGGPWLCTNTYVDESGIFPSVECTGTATSSQPTIAIKISGQATTGAGVPSTCTGTTADAGKVMAKAGTILALLASSTTAGSAAGSGVFSVFKNGVAQTMTCTIGTGTSCADGTTAHQITVAKGDLISVTFATAAAETLCGPATGSCQVSLVIM